MENNKTNSTATEATQHPWRANNPTDEKGRANHDQAEGNSDEHEHSAIHLARTAAAAGADSVKRAASSGLESGAHMAASRANQLGNHADELAQSMREHDLDTLADYADSFSDRLMSASRDLREKSGDQLLGDISRLARRNPSLFILGGVVAGFALARFMKAGTARDNDDYYFDRDDDDNDADEFDSRRAREAANIRSQPPVTSSPVATSGTYAAGGPGVATGVRATGDTVSSSNAHPTSSGAQNA